MPGYLILRKDEPGYWKEYGYIDASSAEGAIREYVKSKHEGGVFLAIPERSAKTIRVKVETVQKVSVDAGEEKD